MPCTQRPLTPISLVLAAALTACGGSGTPLQPIDLSSSSADLSGSPLQDMATASADMSGNGCNGIYSKSTIAAMRQNSAACYELDNVVTIAVTPVGTNTKAVQIYAQDAAGGDYSAIHVGCSSTSTSHPCAAFTNAKNILTGRSVTMQGLYIKSSAANGGFEEFYLDSITDNAAGTAPTPTTLMETDIERGANKTADWFQMVTVNITDKLLMYDWTPAEFVGTGSCPQYGFGMIPTSAGASAGAACPTVSPYTQPAGVTSPNSAEVLVGTDFYSGFTYTTSCACGAMYSDPVPTASQGVSGTITALLNYDVAYGQTVGYQFLDPLTNANFMIQ